MTGFASAAAATAALLLATSSASAQQPAFAGTWLMDMTRSASAAQSEPITPVMFVVQITGSLLTIERRQGGEGRTLRYTIGGGETVSFRGTDEVRGQARWDGTKLVTETLYEVRGIPFAQTEVRSLSSDGREMTVESELVVKHGYEGARPNELAQQPTHSKGSDVYIRQ